MINRKLAEQTIDELSNTGDESLHDLGCGTLRWQASEVANRMCRNPILNEIAALESKYGGVCLEFVESAITLVESRLTQLENARRQLIQQVKKVVIEIRQLEVAELNEV